MSSTPPRIIRLKPETSDWLQSVMVAGNHKTPNDAILALLRDAQGHIGTNAASVNVPAVDEAVEGEEGKKRKKGRVQLMMYSKINTDAEGVKALTGLKLGEAEWIRVELLEKVHISCYILFTCCTVVCDLFRAVCCCTKHLYTTYSYAPTNAHYLL